MRNRKAPEPPEEEGSPAWMNTYGDMVTLLLTFFVLLFSFSTIDAVKWQEIVNSLAGARIVAISELDPNAPESNDYSEGRFVITSTEPNTTPTPVITPSPSEQIINGMTAAEVQNKFNELYEKIKNHIETNNLGYILYVEYIDDETIVLRMSDQAFFDPGSAVIDEQAKAALDEVCDIIKEYEEIINMIHIEGHTDNVPIHNAYFEDNWELGFGRANTVRKYILEAAELTPGLLVAESYGEYHPIATNDTVEGRAQNMRVDFVIESILNG